MTTTTKPATKQDLTDATAKLAEWRKSATKGVAALPGMRAAVESMSAVVKVQAIVNGRASK